MTAALAVPPLPAPDTKFPVLPAALAPLQAEPRWLVWRWEIHWKTGRLTKVPFQAAYPDRHAKSNAARTWGTFEAAAAAYEAGRCHGIGVSLAESAWGSFDLDDCRDRDTGELEEWAGALVQDAASYAEVTVSGTGLRIIGHATGAKVHRCQRVPSSLTGKVETYRGCERFIVVTGDQLPGTPDVLAEIDGLIDRTVTRLDEAAREAREAKGRRKASGFQAGAEREASGSSDERRRTNLPPELERLIRDGAPEGSRSDGFMHAVGWLKDYGWSASDIVGLLSRYPDGIAAKYRDRLEREVERCWDKAETKPRRERAGQRGRPAGPRNGGAQGYSGGEDPSDKGGAPGAHPWRQRASAIDEVVTEDAAAVRFAEMHAGRLRYCHSTGSWFEWTGAAWRQNTTGLAFQWARELARELARPFDDDPKVKAVLGKTAFAAGVERFARSDPAFAVTHEAWDADLWLLGTPGGTVDLRTGELREPDPAEGITRLTAVSPAETPDCPMWLAYLNQATKADPQMIRLLRQLAGYALTGVTTEQVLAFLEGGGGNGKGVFVNTIQHVMGQYAVTAAMETFIASTGDKHPTDLAMLRGARLVTASETEEGRAWAESRIKQMTGGDPITARFMRRDFFTYLPQFLLLIMGNNKPNLNNVDDAMRRRFIMLPFKHRPTVVDPLLQEKLKAEWPAILRWAIEGCLDRQQNGIVRSDRVKEATEAYFATQDLFGQWLAETCDVEPGNEYKWASSKDLFSSWQGYAKNAGEEPGNQRGLADRLEKRDILPVRKHQGRGFAGIRLRVERHWQEAAE
ncbi:MAG: phage/plasmid primase, P4 family [Methylobacterium frigidaeris]